MAITIKTQDQIQRMRVAGAIPADLDEILRDMVKPGVTTNELDRVAEDFIKKAEVRSHHFLDMAVILNQYVHR